MLALLLVVTHSLTKVTSGTFLRTIESKLKSCGGAPFSLTFIVLVDIGLHNDGDDESVVVAEVEILCVVDLVVVF